MTSREADVNESNGEFLYQKVVTVLYGLFDATSVLCTNTIP